MMNKIFRASIPGPVEQAILATVKQKIGKAEEAYAKAVVVIDTEASEAIQEQKAENAEIREEALETYKATIAAADHKLSTETFNIQRDSKNYKNRLLSKLVSKVLQG